MLAQNRLVLSLLLFAFVIVSIAFIDLPGSTKIVREIQNTGHTVVFGFLAVFLLWLLHASRVFNFSRPYYYYVASICICLMAGVFVEALQFITNRDADIYDVIRDLAGIIGVLGTYSVFDNKITSGFGDNSRKTFVAAIVGVIVLLFALYPLARLSYVYLQRYEAFPVIADFDSMWVKDFVYMSDAEISLVATPDGWVGRSGSIAARIKYNPVPKTRFEIDEPQPDWTGYSNLNFKVFSINTDIVTLIVRVNDKYHNQQYSDRFNRSLSIARGENIVRIPLKDIRLAPAGREMNMREIAAIIFFPSRLKKSVSLYMSNIWLD